MRFNPRNGKPNLRIVRNEASPREAEVLLYDVIGGWFGVNAKEFKEELNALDVDTIHARINSPGGSVFDGMAIANALRDHKAKVIVHVDGVAASIASVIALAGDEVRMQDNAFFMIHDPWTLAMGNSADMRKTADLLDKVGNTIVRQYVQATGQSEEQIQQWMKDESWFDAQEAVEHGFADAIDGADETKDSPADLFDFSQFGFKSAPAALLTSDRGNRSEKPTLRELENLLRDAGYSRRESSLAASAAVRSLAQRDAGQDELVRSLQQLASNISTSTR